MIIIPTIGDRSGNVTVLETGFRIDYTNPKKNRSRSFSGIRLKCDCGKEFETRLYSFQTGKSKSCGCVRDKKFSSKVSNSKLEHGRSAINSLYSTYQCGAKRRGIEFSIDKNLFFNLTQQKCHYCGSDPLSEIKQRNRQNGGSKFNGVDRVENEKGYVVGNLVTCCKICNQIKSDRTVEETKQWAVKFLKHQGVI